MFFLIHSNFTLIFSSPVGQRLFVLITNLVSRAVYLMSLYRTRAEKINFSCCCSVSLDPEEDTVDPEQYMGFLRFVEEEMTCEEKCNLLEQTLPNIVTWALRIKELRPPDGVYFSLQQQGL